jgi:RNA polymerase sigma factor (sigma-70 family)
VIDRTDADLVERTRGGNREAYGVLITRYQGHVYGLAYSLSGQWEDAQDIAQETFIRAYVNLDQLRDPARFAAWLRRVTFGVAVNWLKAYRPGLFEKLDGRLDLDTLEIPDFHPGPPEVVEKRELARAVYRALESMPAKYRVPLTMFHLDGLSYEKVAGFLDIPLGTAKSLISRARTKLRAALGDYYGEEITPMVQEVFNEHKLKPEFAKQVLSSIKGVPELKWGEWRDCTFCGAVTVLFNTIGVDVTYEQVMGLSGACYRICMREDWCPSAALPQCGYDVETPLYRALGFQPYAIDDPEARRRKIVECIDKGLPVPCGDQRVEMEWGLITGYANNGEAFFGRTYFDFMGAKAEETFTDDSYFLADKFPGFAVVFLDKRCDPLSPKDALRQSLEVCIGTLNQSPWEEYGYFHGYQAYDLWVRVLESGKTFDEFAGKNGFHIGTLRDARRCAYLYLQQSLDLLHGENRARLERAVHLFKTMFDSLVKFAPLSYVNNETCWQLKDGDWDMPKRMDQARLLREIRAMEGQVEVEFRAILDDWG